MSDVLTYRGYSAKVVFDADDRILTGRVAGIEDGVTFHAVTVEALVSAFQEAVDDYLETCERIGKAPDKAYSGRLMLRVDPAIHAQLAVAAKLSGKSINQFGEDVLGKASAAQIASTRLAELGGSDPHARAAPRRRPVLR